MRVVAVCVCATCLAVAGCRDAGARATSAPATSDADIAAIGSSADVYVDHAAGWREITILAGTVLPVVLDTPVGSALSSVESPVAGRLSRAVLVQGVTVLPAGSRVTGVVTDATRSGKVKGRAHVAVRFDSISAEGARYRVQTASIGRTAPGTKKKDALEIGAPAAGGALIGALVGGKKGALVGTAVGAGGGTAVVLGTRGEEVRLPAGTRLSVRLTAPIRVAVRK